MAGLLRAPGRYRSGPVAVMGEEGVEHIGPPARRVPRLMANLLGWVGTTKEHPLVASSVFHYEFEFIHPFEGWQRAPGPPLADAHADALEGAVCRHSG